ncbi:MAG: phage late control D family protein [Sphingomonadaceae bacterium]|nr:phage late control D family protein [Sphingomonadaceae bacterium]
MSAPQAAVRVTLDGRDLTDRFAPRLSSLTLTEKRGTDADQLDLVLDDADGLLAVPKTGVVVELALGWAQGAGVAIGLVDKGSFTVDEVEHSGSPDVVTLRARSADFTAAARVRKLRSWRATTLGAVIGDLAAGCGLKPAVAPALAAKPIAVLAQGRVSDLAMIRQLGHRFDAVATVKKGRLIFAPAGSGQTASGAALASVTLIRADGDRHSFKRAARDQYTGATAAWHDPKSATRKTVTKGDASDAKVLRTTYGSEADATDAADAEATRQKRAAATMSFTLALGRPDIIPETPLRFSGFKPEIDAQAWIVVEATHGYSSGEGLTTSLSLEAAG